MSMHVPMSQNTGAMVVSALSLQTTVCMPVDRVVTNTQAESMHTPIFHDSRSCAVKNVSRVKKVAMKFAMGIRGYVGSMLGIPWARGCPDVYVWQEYVDAQNRNRDGASACVELRGAVHCSSCCWQRSSSVSKLGSLLGDVILE